MLTKLLRILAKANVKCLLEKPLLVGEGQGKLVRGGDSRPIERRSRLDGTEKFNGLSG